MNKYNKDIPINNEELSILRTKLHSLQMFAKLFSILGILLPIVGIILSIVYQMEGYVVIYIILSGMFEWIALMEISDRFKKEFKEINNDQKGVSDE